MAEQYRITSQRPTTEINPSGMGFRSVWEIHYEVTAGPARGTTAYVTVPDEDHNADYIKDAIETKLKALHEIASL